LKLPLAIFQDVHRPEICVWFAVFRTRNFTSEHRAGSKQKSYKAVQILEFQKQNKGKLDTGNVRGLKPIRGQAYDRSRRFPAIVTQVKQDKV
jgi:hypothetical protein